MIEVLRPGSLRGTIAAISSKSQAHRLLICAALSSTPSTIRCDVRSQDITATMDCLRAMGAEISAEGVNIAVSPLVKPGTPCQLPCRESGSTLRFLLPVCGALGLEGCFQMEGRLPERPMEPLTDVLCAHGMEIRRDGDLLHFHGQLTAGTYRLPGDVSSQYLSGLLFALPLLSGSSALQITTPLQSGSYLQMTVNALQASGVTLAPTAEGFHIPGNQRPRLTGCCPVEGDWSNAAFFLCAGAVSAPVTVTGLDLDSPQGDRAILALLGQFGAAVTVHGDTATVSPRPLHGITVDAGEIPDLVPVLSAVAAAAQGDTHIKNAGRLRLKESDRLSAVTCLLRDLGGSVEELPEGLIVHGGQPLTGGTADSRGDHRMAMTAAVCSLICQNPVTIRGAACVRKSYPDFFQDFASLWQEERI